MFCLIHKSSHVHSLWHIVLWDFLLPSHGGRKSTSSSAWGAGKPLFQLVSLVVYAANKNSPSGKKRQITQQLHQLSSPFKTFTKHGTFFVESHVTSNLARMARWVVSFTMMAMQSGMSPWVLPLVLPGTTLWVFQVCTRWVCVIG